MEQSLKRKLLQSREAIKRKFNELRSDVVHQENYLEKKFKPIADPLKELLKNVKIERPEIKPESQEMSFITPEAFSSPKQKKTSPQSLLESHSRLQRTSSFLENQPVASHSRLQPTVSFLESQPVAQYDPIEEEVDEFVHIDPQQLEDIQHRSRAVQEYIESYGGLSKEYILGHLLDTVREYDTTYGPRREILKDRNNREYDTGKWLLGSGYIDFNKNGDYIYITTRDRKTFTYKGSLALYELIFKNVPNKAVVEKDMQAKRDYKDIIERTNLHKRGFSANAPLRSNSGRKYMDFIKPITKGDFNEPKPIRSALPRPSIGGQPKPNRSLQSSSSIGGRGMLNLENKKVQYVPYKNPNTLVGRLRILLGSKLAGNTSNDNEIVYIIEELKRSKIIK